MRLAIIQLLAVLVPLLVLPSYIDIKGLLGIAVLLAEHIIKVL
jgi:hypothetical protein